MPIGEKTKLLWKNYEYRKHMSEIHKGKSAWNKGKHPTYMKGNIFAKGNKANKASFKKGCKPWNKGTRGICKAWNKGKPCSQETKRKISIANKGNIAWNKNKWGLYKHSKKFKNIMSKRWQKEKNPRWKGGKCINGDDYILIMQKNHPHPNHISGYVFEHRLVMEKMIKRYLKPQEIVHHKGIKYPLGSIKNKQDNREENLQLFPNKSKHAKFHFILKKSPE